MNKNKNKNYTSKFEIIHTPIKKECRNCGGCGKIKNFRHFIKCPNCNGTGIYIDQYWYIITNNIAMDMDTLK